jgi:hypothetical protein
MCNIPFYSFRFPLSNVFGIFQFGLMVRNFQDQNCGVSSWENWTFLTPLQVQSRLQSCRGCPKHFCLYGRDCCWKNSPKKVWQGNFDMSNTMHLGQPCCASGGIWRGLSIMNCLRGTWASLLNVIVNNFAVWRKQSSKGPWHGVILQYDNADHTLQTWQ